jgi:hypothetical protein
VIDQYLMKLEDDEEPEDLNEEPKDLIFFVDAGDGMEVEAFYALAALPTVIFARALVAKTLRANILQCWELWCPQQSHEIDIPAG